LIVDDNRDAADSMGAVVRLLGHNVKCTYEGETALQLAERFRPEVVLLDLGMPGLDGFAIRERLAQLPGLEHVCTVALTGYGNDADKRRTRDAGFNHHLTKPLDLSELKQLLEDVVPL
jgi:CheY-like chemotaxis protein